MPSHSLSRPLVVFPDADAEGLELLEYALTVVDASGIEIRHHLGVPRSDAEWIDRVSPADGMLLGWKLPNAALRSAERLQLISYLGTGVSDHVDLNAAAAQNVIVTNVAGYGDDAVAEHATALLLAALRDVPRLDAAVRAGSWPQVGAWQLRGSRLGVVGLGGIGRRMAAIGAGLGMEVVAWNRSAETGSTEAHGIALVPLDELLATSDAVSLHVPLNGDTRGLLDARRLSLMKPESILVNTARGAVVDETALLQALDAGSIRAAALDVFDQEPIDPNNPLLKHDRTVVTPHVAFNTGEAARELFVRALRNVVDHFAS
ncbi:MAG: NAD(P)-dependent oxidoreductase [Homoserinimonas sp.]